MAAHWQQRWCVMSVPFFYNLHCRLGSVWHAAVPSSTAAALPHHKHKLGIVPVVIGFSCAWVGDTDFV